MVSLSPAAARHLQLLLEERKLDELPSSVEPDVASDVQANASQLTTLSQSGAAEYSKDHSSGHSGAAGTMGQGLRVVVEKGGCAGLQYTMILDVWRAGDTTVQRDGVSVFIDSASLPYLAGAQLDYCDDLVGTGFRLHNPNAVRSCGCGTSFEPSVAAGTAEGLVGATNLGALGGEVGVVMEGAG